MKILYIITQAEMGGAQKSVLLLADRFRGEIAAGIEKKELFLKATELNITTWQLKYLIRGINPIFDLFGLYEIFSLVKKVKPDIIHLNSSKAGFLGSIAGKLAGSKVVFTARGFVFNEPHVRVIKYFYIFLEKFASLFRDQIITISKADELAARKYKIINSNKVTTINNAVPEIIFISKGEAVKKLAIPKDRFIIGTIANYYSTKGLDILIEAISKLDKKVANKIKLLIIGSGPLDETLKLLTNNLKLSGTVMFSGQIPEASTLLKAFDIFVLPSRKEGFPLVLLEAMKAGLPIIATDVGGNKEALGEAGLTIPPHSPKVLSSILTNLINDGDLRNQLSQKALERSKKFTLEKLFKETETVYNRVIQI